ncbi:hypothetical protein SAMN05660282_01417 [Corynebacterium spheniscorum]|uniref:Uncharacterized protein n=1 Tax=Corynebacterium spheniscorum TaxID=185761 RepID=A0A1I2TJP5_9CORY|nr:hypothetical protein SAMN05660282_01417 [Corynebacterium spheniscorum]
MHPVAERRILDSDELASLRKGVPRCTVGRRRFAEPGDEEHSPDGEQDGHRNGGRRVFEEPDFELSASDQKYIMHGGLRGVW